jgi:hypothetical protein
MSREAHMKNVIVIALIGLSLATSSWGIESCRDYEYQKIKDMSAKDMQDNINAMVKIQEGLVEYQMKMDDVSGKYAWSESRKTSAGIFECNTKIISLQNIRDKKNVTKKTTSL